MWLLFLRENGSIFDKLGFRPIAFQIGLHHKGFRAEYGVRLRGGRINPANCAAQFLSLDSPCGWGSIWGFGVFMVPREWKPCLGNVLCGRGGSVVGFLGLSCVFALAGVLSGGLGFPRKETPRNRNPS